MSGSIMGAGLEQALEDIKNVSVLVTESGCTPASGGNLSLDVTDIAEADGVELRPVRQESLPLPVPGLAGRMLFVTASGARFRDVARKPSECLVLLRIAEDGNDCDVLWGGENGRKPTMEFVPHLKVHTHLHDEGLPFRAVLHTHPVHLIALSHLPEYRTREFARLLQTSQTTAMVFHREGVGRARYARMGSVSLADQTVEQLSGRRAVLWERHGCLTVGRDVCEAFDLTDLLEKAAQVFFACVSAGHEPRRMTPREIRDLGY